MQHRVASHLVALPLVSVLSACVFAEEATSPLEGRHLSHIEQVTSDWVKAGEGYFSPDGQTIVYQAVKEGYPFYQIYTQSRQPSRTSSGRGPTTATRPAKELRSLAASVSY